MSTITTSNPQSIFTPEGNSLAVFVDADGVMKIKDVNGQIALLNDFITKPTLYAGSFYDTTLQTNGGATSSNQVLIGNTQLNNGFTLNLDNSITILNTATYFFSCSLQLAFTGGASNYNVTVWYSIDNTIEPNSSFTFTTTGAQNDQTLAVVSDTKIINAGQKIKFYWWSQATGMRLLPTSAGTNPTRPLSPSVNINIFNVG
jgi:hypothetical protein